MKNVFALTSYALENPKTHVLIRGEEGVGKELVARACAEKHLPFKALNCAGISDSLLQSELFGHEKGSYTGAISRHEGLIAAARGGSLFLDEFGDLSLRAQAALLRAAEYGEIKKVGSTATEFIEFRIIAATNANLEYKIARGNFRQDFLSRFTRLQITIPPLRERPEDIEVIVHHIIATHDKHKDKKFSKDCIHLFEQYSWPGNVRQLQNLVLSILETTNQKMISISDLPNEFLDKFARKETATLGNLSDCHLNLEPTYRQSLTEAIRDYERFIIKKHIASLGCSTTKTSLAASLGIPRTSLRRKLTNLNISIKD